MLESRKINATVASKTDHVKLAVDFHVWIVDSEGDCKSFITIKMFNDNFTFLKTNSFVSFCVNQRHNQS